MRHNTTTRGWTLGAAPRRRRRTFSLKCSLASLSLSLSLSQRTTRSVRLFLVLQAVLSVRGVGGVRRKVLVALARVSVSTRGYPI